MLATETNQTQPRRPDQPRCFVIVVARDRAALWRSGSFCEVRHGRRWPLEQMQPGDWVLLYSGRQQERQGGPCQRFTAAGRVALGETYRHQMTADHMPWRRRVDYYHRTEEVAIAPLLPRLSFIGEQKQWGLSLGHGFLEVSAMDAALIAHEMGLEEEAAHLCGAFAY